MSSKQPPKNRHRIKGLVTLIFMILLLSSILISPVSAQYTLDANQKTTDQRQSDLNTPSENETEPEPTRPNNTTPQPDQSNNIQPNSTEPNNTVPDTEPKNDTDTNSTKPKVDKPNGTVTNNTQPNATDPKDVDPNSTEPNNTEPEPKPKETPHIAFTENITDYGFDLESDDDRLFDYLVIEVSLLVNQPGKYELGSYLILRENYPTVYVYNSFETEDNKINLKLKFDGEHISKSGVDNNYICVLWLETSEGEVIQKTEYKTQYYEHLEFKHPKPPLILTERFSTFGNDTDNNGLFNRLTIKFLVEVNEPGYYYFLAGLFVLDSKNEKEPDLVTEDEKTFDEKNEDYTEEEFYDLIAKTRRTGYLSPGEKHIQMHFNGPVIHYSGHVGSFFVGLWAIPTERPNTDDPELTTEEKKELLERENELFIWPMVGEGDLTGDLVFKTNEYFYSDFEEPPKIAKFNEQFKENTEDSNRNKLIDVFILTVGVRVTEAGHYNFWGRIVIKMDNEWQGPVAEFVTYLEEGTHFIKLEFKGSEIYRTKIEGQFRIILVLNGRIENEYPATDKFVYTTENKYSYKDFEHEIKEDENNEIQEENRPYAKLDSEGVTTKTDVMEIYTPKTRPEITFWYADVDSNGAKFKVIYNRLIGFSDLNRNGQYDFGEEQFQVMLQDSLWTISRLQYSVNTQYGNYVEFYLRTELVVDDYSLKEKFLKESDISSEVEDEETKNEIGTRQDTTQPVDEREFIDYESENYLTSWGKLTIKFLVTSNDFTIDQPIAYNINGDTEVKIDIDLELYKPVDIDGITFEQIIFDETQTYGIKTKEQNEENVYQPNRDLEKSSDPDSGKPEMLQFEPRQDDLKQWIVFIDNSEKEYGFYSWVNQINVTYFDGSSDIVEVNTTYAVDGNALRLFINYPYQRDVQSYHHEPSVGMIKESKPSSKEEVDELTKILLNPWYLAGMIISVTILIVLIKSQTNRGPSKKRRKNQVEINKYEREPERKLSSIQRPQQKYNRNHRPSYYQKQLRK